MSSRFYIKIHGQLVRQGLENFAEEIPKVGRQRIYLRMVRIRTRLRQPAPKPGYPIHWDSERQKRAYFATNGFGAGIPYQRKGTTEAGWVLESLDDGYRLANETTAAFFVYGDLFKRKSQSRIHAGRWPETKVVAFEELSALPEEIQADIDVAKQRSGL